MWDPQLNSGLVGRLGLITLPGQVHFCFQVQGSWRSALQPRGFLLARAASIHCIITKIGSSPQTGILIYVFVLSLSAFILQPWQLTVSVTRSEQNALGGVDTLLLSRSPAPRSGRPPPHSCGAAGMGQHRCHYALGFVPL